MSNLSAFPFIQEKSEATPGLWNQPFSIISSNIAAMNVDLSLGSFVGLTLAVDSNVSDYLTLTDTSAQRSNYIIGSHIGGTADGLTLYDTSGSTSIVNFSKQSVRFYVPVIARALDVGGAAFSVTGFGAIGNGVADDSAAIQAAVDVVPTTGGAVQFPFGTYSVSTTIRIPTDRVVTLFGTGGFGTNVSGLRSAGCVIKATSALSGSKLFSQETTATSGQPGLQMYGLCLDGNDQTVDLLVLKHLNQVQVREVSFFNSNGNGILATGLENSSFALCRFFEVGNTTAYPTGACSVMFLSDAILNTNTVFLDTCYWECGRGTYLASYDPTGTHPIDLISVTGGKMEQTNNFHNLIPGLPFVLPGNGTAWDINGTQFVNGLRNGATHIHILNCNNSRFRTFHEINSIYTDGTSPQYLVNLFAGNSIYLGGTYIGGGAATGAQIRVVESSCKSYVIDPTNVYLGVLSGGTEVRFTNPTADAAAPLRTAGPVWLSNNGSAIAPQVAFGSEASLGFYRSGASRMALSWGTLETPSLNVGGGTNPAIYTNPSGNSFVGLGTTNPLSSLHIVSGGASAQSQGILLQDISGNLAQKAGYIKLSHYTNAESPIALLRGVATATANIIDIGGNATGQYAATIIRLVTDGTGNSSTTVPTGTTQVAISSQGTVGFNRPCYVSNDAATTPGWAWSAETQLGWYRSGTSTVALSKGTLDLTGGGAVTSIASLTIKSGSNNACGTATLGSNGSVNVANTYVKTGDLIFLTDQTPGGTLGDLEILGIRNSSGFTIGSTSVTDTSTIAWLIVRPG